MNEPNELDEVSGGSRPADEGSRDLGGLFDRHGGALLAVALAITGSHADAEDAVQQTFLDLYRSRAALARAAEPRAYLFRALRNAALRLRGRRQPVPWASVAEMTAEPQEVSEALPGLERALARLPREQREVLALKIEGELTFAEIGAALGLSANTAASRYRYALERLRAELGAVR